MNKGSEKTTRFFRHIAVMLTIGLLTFAARAQARAPPPAKGAANSIESINVAAQQGGNVVVRINLKQPLSNPPAGFMINNPPRLAFDFPNTANATGKNSQEV